MSGSAQEAETPHLLAHLATIADPRTRAGRRHPLVAILGLAAAAVVAGARSITAIAEWAATLPSRSVPRSAPRASTSMRVSGAQCLARLRLTRPAGGDPRQPARPDRRAEREGWLGEVKGLTVSLAGAKDKLAQLERRGRSHAVDLSIPTVPASR